MGEGTAQGRHRARGGSRPSNTPPISPTCIRRSTTTRRSSRPTAAISATTRPACRPARPRSTSRCSSARSSTGNPLGAAETIFEQNILGGMCARVCPTETLCEEACVREAAEGKPVKIGQLQRYATDIAMRRGQAVLRRAPRRPARRVAVVGAGPAGLACAHRLAMHGHEVTIFEARAEGRRPQRIRHRRLQDAGRFRPGRGRLRHRHRRHRHRERQGARPRFHARRPDARTTTRCSSAWALAASTRCAPRARTPTASTTPSTSSPSCARPSDLGALPVGRRVVVIGGGMTAIDAAVQSKLLGAEEVTIVYRRGQEQMNASGFEQDLAPAKGVTIRHWLQPKRVDRRGRQGQPASSSTTRPCDGDRLAGTGETLTLAADQVFKAIGQTLRAGGAQRQRRCDRARRRPDRGRCRGPHLAGQGLGRRRLRLRRRRPDRDRRRRRPRRGREHPPAHSTSNGRA